MLLCWSFVLKQLMQALVAVKPPEVEDTAATVGERSDLFGPEGSLMEVATAVARNSHRSWARQKLADGWTYAPEDSVLASSGKTTPLLVPFKRLPSEIKTQNVNIVLETLKVMYHYGYEIVPAQGDEATAMRRLSNEGLDETTDYSSNTGTGTGTGSALEDGGIAKPVNLAGTSITRGEMELAEMLVRNAHAIWVQGKIKRGWVYKPKWLQASDDADKNTKEPPSSPLLVPYEQVGTHRLFVCLDRYGQCKVAYMYLAC